MSSVHPNAPETPLCAPSYDVAHIVKPPCGASALNFLTIADVFSIRHPASFLFVHAPIVCVPLSIYGLPGRVCCVSVNTCTPRVAVPQSLDRFTAPGHRALSRRASPLNSLVRERVSSPVLLLMVSQFQTSHFYRSQRPAPNKINHIRNPNLDRQKPAPSN